MKLSTRTRMLFTSCISAVVLVTSCGNGSDGAASQVATSESGGSSSTSEMPSNTTVVVAVNGGMYADLVAKVIDAPFEAQGWEVTQIANSHTDKLTKMRVEKDATGSMDVIQLPDNYMYQADHAGLLLDPLDSSKIPNWAHIQDELRTSYMVPHITSAMTIAYNTEHISEKPDSYAIFWDSQYKGKVGVVDEDYQQWLFVAATQASGGSDSNNWDAGWPKLKTLVGQQGAKVFPTLEAMESALSSGEIWLSLDWRARAASLATDGKPIGNTVAQEGIWPTVFGFGIPKNAPNKAGAYAYLNQLLAPDGQVDFAKALGYSPVVDNVSLPDNLAGISFTDEERQKFITRDFDYITENQAIWNEKWQREID